MVQAMSAAYRAVSCWARAASGGLVRTIISLSTRRSAEAPSALPKSSASAISPETATTASDGSDAAGSRAPGACTATSSKTTTCGEPLVTETDETGTPKQCAVSRCAASCLARRSSVSCFAVADLKASNGRKRIPGATEPMARMPIGTPAIR
eukprot:scaffold2645_cov112-Isochrysis_galbana.AAC.3